MNLHNVETFYPLAPAQKGVLFHSLYDPDAHVYFGQLGLTFCRMFDPSALERAWRKLCERHTALRTFFVWEGLPEPVQVVQERVEIEIERFDWSNLPDIAQREALAWFLKSDRERGMELTKAPLMRLTLARLSEERYRLIWSHHHAVMDGWSAPLVLKEFLTLYTSYQQGGDVSLPAVRPYRDYIVWLAKQDLTKAEVHWRALLKGFDEPTSITIDRATSRPQEPTEEAQSDSWECEIEVSSHVLKALQDIARKWRLTLNTMIQGAWAILVSRYSGKNDVVYGTTVSGRPAELEGVEEMVGLFINTLPMRVCLRPEMRVEELLRKLQQQQVELRQYEYCPLIDVHGWSDVPRGVALFESIFVFGNYPTQKVPGKSGRAPVVDELTFDQRTNYPLTVTAGANEKLELRILYDARRYREDSIRLILRQMARILESIAARPEQLSDTVEVLTPEESESLRGWNHTSCDYPKNKTVTELFEIQAERSRGDIAVMSDSERLSYENLDLYSNQLARYLREKGVAPEQVVGVCLDRSPAMIVTLLGILKAGGAYLTLDASYPQARLKHMLEDTDCHLVLTEEKYADKIAMPGKTLMFLDKMWIEIADQSTERVACSACSTNLAYVIYTSGSTGEPKGVMVQHRSLVNLIQAQARSFDVKPESRVLQFASPSFDASVSELFMALLSGATLHIASPEALRPGSDLIGTLRSRQITVATLPPSVLAVLDHEHLPHLKTVVTAGEQCPAEVVMRWAPDRRFINAYGPTETTVCATMSKPLLPAEFPAVGRPLSNGRVFLLNFSGHLVPVGAEGELYVGGDLLARGYFNRPDLTAERFLPDPFSGEPGARLYRTGDRARFLPDGNIQYIGRMDRQAKIRGFRIEPGEIEAILGQHAKVSKAMVTVREDVIGDKKLVAYVVPDGESAPNPRELQQVLREKLPEYMIPSAFVVLSAFPLTANGKVDIRALPSPSGNRAESGEKLVAPRNEAERIIARLWCEVLGLDKVDIYEHFFDLGGHSLLLLRCQGKLKELFGKDISLLQMFHFSTVSSLAEYFVESELQTANPPFSGIQERVNRRREARKRREGKLQPFRERQVHKPHNMATLSSVSQSPVDPGAGRGEE